MKLNRFARFFYQPVLPIGRNRTFVTNSKAHWDLAAQIAAEGTVLLKNDGTLPLQPGAKICLFGLGAGDFVFGGGGSGFVYADNKISLSSGLETAAKAGKLEFFQPLADFYWEQYLQFLDRVHEETGMSNDVLALSQWRKQNQTPMPILPESLYQQAKEFGDTAVFCLSRYSSEGDYGGDRKGGKGDFYLWDEEQALLDRLCKDYRKVIVVLNTCGPVSTEEYANNPRVGAVLYPLYGGGMAGTALTRLLLGEAYPSGHLQHTLAKRLEDYPSTAGFHDHENYVNYTEDIFVGYRYFETMAPEKVVYPYGFGLTYTTFQ